MIDPQDTSVLIVGYGREGRSVHRYCMERHPELRIGVADHTPVDRLEGPATVHSGSGYLHNILDYDSVVRSPGIPPTLPELERSSSMGRRVTTLTNIFFSECRGVTIGVTGTKGKSTTSALIAGILTMAGEDVRLVGNIGNPALDHLAMSTERTHFVIELSSQQLVDAEFSPHIAVVLNVVPEHLDFHGDFESYLSAKAHIVDRQTDRDVVVFNPAHDSSGLIASRSRGTTSMVSLGARPGAACYLKEDHLVAVMERREVKVIARADIPLLGEGNLENVLAAIAVGVRLGVSVETIGRAISTFQPLRHRLEYIGERGGIRFFNDSLATVPEATVHALAALGDDVETLVAGGRDRGADFSALGAFLAGTRVKNLILFPDTGERIAAAAASSCRRQLDVVHVTSMKAAISNAFAKTGAGRICLLSPGSASFGTFRDYADRGDQFRRLVHEQLVAER